MAHRPASAFLGTRLLIVTAHPDDESYCAAGTIYLNTRAGGETLLVCATLGELGSSHLKRKTTKAKLKSRRRRELARAARFLGVRRVVHAGIPDGALRRRAGTLFRAAMAAARAFKPDCILTFGADGLTGHHDHIAAGKVGARVARRLRVPLYAFTLPPALTRRGLSWLKSRRVASHYSNSLRYRKPDVRIPISTQVKRRALGFHRSQMDGPAVFSGYPAFAVQELLRAEYFVKFRP
jgi:LmbE family N-acetylglucosaminyl deacetylase